MARSPKGGTIGMNGERYEGGQFLPSTTLPKMTPAQQKAATRKQEIAPYTWEVAPSPELRSIYRLIAGTYAKWKEFGVSFEPFLPFIERCEEQYPDFNRATYINLIERWNNGERWTER